MIAKCKFLIFYYIKAMQHYEFVCIIAYFIMHRILYADDVLGGLPPENS